MTANGNVGSGGGTEPTVPRVRVWTMPTAGLDEATVAPWRDVLDDTERARAARFLHAENRIGFVAAHALTRAALGTCTGHPPAAFAYTAGAHGKPEATIGDRPAGVAFNLSHTKGMVGVAVAAGEGALGFDLEPVDRRAPLQIARRYFTAEEVAWLDALPEAGRAEGFFRLWTLKEAFIKATGKGLTQDLASFWFRVTPPAIRFAPGLPGTAEDWVFEQRRVHRDFLAALALHRVGDAPLAASWTELDPAAFAPD